jgi:hypothetical protein
MSKEPRCQGCDLADAADIKTGQEQPVNTISAAKSQALARVRRQRQIELIHALGPRVTFELLDEIARHHHIGADLDHRLQLYCGIEPEILAAVGGDKFAAVPTRLVGGVR